MLRGAARYGHVETVKLLLENGVDPTLENRGHTALHLAILSMMDDKGIATVEILLEKFPTLVNIAGTPSNEETDPTSPLQLACMSPASLNTNKDFTLELVRLLIDKGADISILNSQNETLLHLVALGTYIGLTPPDPEVIKLLINAGVDVNAKNSSQETAAEIARKRFPGWFDKNKSCFNKIDSQ